MYLMRVWSPSVQGLCINGRLSGPFRGALLMAACDVSSDSNLEFGTMLLFRCETVISTQRDVSSVWRRGGKGAQGSRSSRSGYSRWRLFCWTCFSWSLRHCLSGISLPSHCWESCERTTRGTRTSCSETKTLHDFLSWWTPHGCRESA